MRPKAQLHVRAPGDKFTRSLTYLGDVARAKGRHAVHQAHVRLALRQAGQEAGLGGGHGGGRAGRSNAHCTGACGRPRRFPHSLQHLLPFLPLQFPISSPAQMPNQPLQPLTHLQAQAGLVLLAAHGQVKGHAAPAVAREGLGLVLQVAPEGRRGVAGLRQWDTVRALRTGNGGYCREGGCKGR